MDQVKNKFITPAAMGAKKKDNIFHWSIDELIEYRSTGVNPKMIIDEKYIFRLAQIGVSIQNICGLFGITAETFCSNETYLNAHKAGRAQLASKVRSVLATQALEGNTAAAMYIDRFLGGDVEVKNIDLTVTQRPLQEASTETLIDVVVHESNQDTDPA